MGGELAAILGDKLYLQPILKLVEEEDGGKKLESKSPVPTPHPPPHARLAQFLLPLHPYPLRGGVGMPCLTCHPALISGRGLTQH